MTPDKTTFDEQTQKLAEEYFNKTGYAPTEWAVMNFSAGYRARDEEVRILREALEFYAKEVQKDHWDDGSFKEEFYAELPLGRRARYALEETKDGGCRGSK